MLERHKVALATNGSGDATGYTPATRGLVQAVFYDFVDMSAGVMTITEEDTGHAILALATMPVVDTLYLPRAKAQDGLGSDLTYDGSHLVNDRVPVQGRVKVVVASGGATKTGNVYVYVAVS